jgi:cation transport regulator ChaB
MGTGAARSTDDGEPPRDADPPDLLHDGSTPTEGSGMPIENKSDLPDTIERSPAKAQRTFRKAYNSALETYEGDEERARRTAYSALKHEFEKVEDHWEPKDGSGPSDERAERGADQPGGETAGGVDVRGHTKKELYERAKQLGIEGRSKMDKQELAQKIAQQQD